MSKHINLITRHRARKSIALFASAGLGTLFVGCVIWGVMAELEMQRMADEVTQTQKVLVNLQVELQKKRQAVGVADLQMLTKDSSEMQRAMGEHRALLLMLQKGEIGNLQGHAMTLETLATMTQTGVWLQGVEVSKSGQTMRITGTALSTAAVIQYAGQLNQSFNTFGTAFTSLELSKEEWGGPTATQKIEVLKFKLY